MAAGGAGPAAAGGSQTRLHGSDHVASVTGCELLAACWRDEAFITMQLPVQRKIYANVQCKRKLANCAHRRQRECAIDRDRDRE